MKSKLFLLWLPLAVVLGCTEAPPTAPPAGKPPVGTGQPATPQVTIKLFKDDKGEWRWNRKAANNKVIGASSESFKNKQDAIGNAQLNYGENLVIEE